MGQERTRRTWRTLCAAWGCGLALTGLAVCGICDWALTGALTWSRIPISAILFAGLVCAPLIRLGGAGVGRALAVFSVLLFPFLYVLGSLLGQAAGIMRIGGGPAAASLLFLWGCCGVFRLLPDRKLLASSLTALFAVVLSAAINWSLAETLRIPLVDGWDLLSVAVLLAAALLCFLLDRRRARATI